MSNEDWNELDESYRSALSGALETAHPAVEQAGGDERAAFEAYRDRRNALLESEGHNPGSKWHVTNAHYPTWEASRAALAQPSPAQAEGFTHFPELLESVQQMDAMLKAEVERPEVVGSAWRNIYNNGFDHVAPFPPAPGGPVVDEPLMTVAQHAASVARWAEMFNRVEQERDAALARVAELVAALERAATAMWNSESNMDNEAAAVEEAIGNAKSATPVAQAQQLHDLDAQCRDDVARALGLRPSQERGFAWSYLLASIKSCVKASEDAAQAQRSVPEEFSFEYRHPNGECHTVTASREQVINEMPDFLFEALCSKLCNCEPVGETNVVECRCDEYAEEFKLIAAAPGNEGV